MTYNEEDLAFRARALAQAHPFTSLAQRYLNRIVGEQRASQPLPEIGTWAGAALTGGYCLRRVEENEAGLTLEASSEVDIDLDRLDEVAVRVAADVRTGAGDHSLVDDERVVAALDRLVHTEVDKRLEHWRDSVDDKAWAELEEYLTWWVVKGYALRIAETTTGAVS
jgi:hypothetical protein